jgi:hypothetical protein
MSETIKNNVAAFLAMAQIKHIETVVHSWRSQNTGRRWLSIECKRRVYPMFFRAWKSETDDVSDVQRALLDALK